MANGDSTLSVENKQKIIALENSIHRDMKPQIKELFEAVAMIKDDLLKRPSWAVTIIITVLTSSCVGLLVVLLKGSI